MVNYFFDYLTPFILGGPNFSISNMFATILNVLDVPKGDFNFYLYTKSNGVHPRLVYRNTIVASNVRLNWFMRFAMEFFIPHLLTSNPNLDNI